jgi:ABC-type branched-subunit amino acid transport system substrate-binding protein/serine/threonine protein kinase
MDIYCTRPHCEQPLNSFADLDDSRLLKTVHQRHCSNCGMPLILDGRYLPLKLLQQGELVGSFIGGDRQTPELKRCVIRRFQMNPSFNTTQLEIATKQFYREAEVLEKLGDHPRIPRLFALLESTASAAPPHPQQKFFYLVQEYIEGQNLQAELLAKGKFTESEVILILREIARILEFIHFQDTIHRDIKPSNIIRDLQGNIHLIDFGAVKQVITETTPTTAEGQESLICVFTPEYAPDEQRQGQAIYPSSDLYALAVTCLNLLTGKQPQDLLDINSNNWQWRTPDLQVSDFLAEILDKMLQDLPQERFQSARDVLDALDATLGVPIFSIPTESIPAASITTATTMLSVAIDHHLPQIEHDRLNRNPPPIDNHHLNHNPAQIENDRPQLDDPQLPIDTYNYSPFDLTPTYIQHDRAPLALTPTYIQHDCSPFALTPTYIQHDRAPLDDFTLTHMSGTPTIIQSQKPSVMAVVLAIGLVGLSTIIISRIWQTANSGSTMSDLLTKQSSMGERILLSIEGDKDTDKFKKLKRAGVLAIANKKYAEAVTKLEAALAENPNAPETRIYLNNALIGDNKSYTIAVSVPISSRSIDRASEMLRGFAQAQAEIDQTGNVNEAKIKLRIVDDGDDPKIVESIATELAKQPEILGVAGHNRNDVTMKASTIYSRGKVAFIAPISTANRLTGSDKPYIFRTNTKGDTIAQKLVDHLVDVDRKLKIAIFYVPSIPYNDEFKNQFTNKLVARGGEVVSTFPFSTASSAASSTTAPAPIFDAEADLRKAKRMGAEAILLLPVGRSSREALQILKIRSQKYPRLDVMSDTALYNLSTLQAGDEARDLVIGVPWQESESTPQFSTGAKQLWNNQVNWATATSYNAVKALGTAIKAQEPPSRESVIKILSKHEFMGASTRKFQFINGDPTDRYILVKVSKTPPNYKYSSSTGYDFVPLE